MSFHYMHVMPCFCLAYLIFYVPFIYNGIIELSDFNFCMPDTSIDKSFPSASPSGGAFLSLLTALLPLLSDVDCFQSKN